MAVFRIEKNRNYTTMSNYHLRDRRLSLKAKGLLSLILSLPDGWDYSVRGLAAICKESPDGIATPLKELEKYGYLFREALPKRETPCTEKPYTVKPDTAIPISEQPRTVTPAQIKKEEENTEKENTEINNYLSNQSTKQKDADRMKMERDLFKNRIKKNISYEILSANPALENEVDELVELMTDTVCSNEPFVRIAGKEIPTAVVEERFLRIEEDHIIYVIDSLRKVSAKIHNIRQYLLTALYNAPVTISNYYTVEVQHDMRGG